MEPETEPGSTPPAALRRRVEDFVGRQNAMAPDTLAEILVTGSGALGDWSPGRSDVDLVFVLRRPLVRYELDWLAGLHRSTVDAGPIDGVYLTAPQLAAGPVTVGRAPQVVAGELDPDAAGKQLTWVTWREIEGAPCCSVGPGGALTWGVSTYRFPGIDERVRDASRRNLGDYWEPLGRRLRTYVRFRRRSSVVDPEMVRWAALGPPRLVATVETGDVVSKTRAAAFAAERWPEFAPLLLRVLASRQGADETFTKPDGAAAVDLLERCVAAGRASR